LLVKFTKQSRAKLKVTAGEVNPAATGLGTLDVISHNFGVTTFRSIITPGGHRNSDAAINSWYKLTLPGQEQRLTLVAQSPDAVKNLVVSGADLLGPFLGALEQDPNVESVALDYIVRTEFVPNDPYYSAPYPTTHYGNVSQYAPQLIGAVQAWDTTKGD